MPRLEIERIEIYDASLGTITIEENEIYVPTEEELILEKQNQLIQIYNEIEYLKTLTGTTI
jgi:hypothetical protein